MKIERNLNFHINWNQKLAFKVSYIQMSMNEPEWNGKFCVANSSHPLITEYYNSRGMNDNMCAWSRM